jgi:omega-amidase
MADTLKIAGIQSNLHWENPTANLAMFEEKIANLPADTDIIVLPEMFTTGFSMSSASLAEPPKLHTHKWLAMIAQQRQALVMGSYIVNDGGHYFNRLLAIEPNGNYHVYNKRHLFRMGAEHQHYTAGTEQLIINYKGLNIRPLICYDLRFPVWSRNQANAYDLLIYVANWPAPRAQAWRCLLQARAIENQCYLMGVNRIGTDAQGLQYSGDSLFTDYKGQLLADAAATDGNIIQHIKLTELRQFRQAFPTYLDADNFTLNN